MVAVEDSEVLAVEGVDAYLCVVVGCSAAGSEYVRECYDCLHELGLSRIEGQRRWLDSFGTEIGTHRRHWRN